MTQLVNEDLISTSYYHSEKLLFVHQHEIVRLCTK